MKVLPPKRTRTFRVRRAFRLRPLQQIGPQRFFGPCHATTEVFLTDLYPTVEYAFFQWRKLYGGYHVVSLNGETLRRRWENGLAAGKKPTAIFPGALDAVLSPAEADEIPNYLPARWVRILMSPLRYWLVAQPVHNKHYAK